jgi:hypothetical protein
VWSWKKENIWERDRNGVLPFTSPLELVVLTLVTASTTMCAKNSASTPPMIFDDIEVRAVFKILSRPKASVDKDKWRSIKSHASFLANR